MSDFARPMHEQDAQSKSQGNSVSIIRRVTVVNVVLSHCWI